MIHLVPAWLRDLPPRRVDLVVTAVVTAATVVPLLLPSPREWWPILLGLTTASCLISADQPFSMSI